MNTFNEGSLLHVHFWKIMMIIFSLSFLSDPETNMMWILEVYWCFPVGNRADAEVFVQIADGLREIAAQLEHNVVAQATQNLGRNIDASYSPQVSNLWAQGLLNCWCFDGHCLSQTGQNI